MIKELEQEDYEKMYKLACSAINFNSPTLKCVQSMVYMLKL